MTPEERAAFARFDKFASLKRGDTVTVTSVFWAGSPRGGTILLDRGMTLRVVDGRGGLQCLGVFAAGAVKTVWINRDHFNKLEIDQIVPPSEPETVARDGMPRCATCRYLEQPSMRPWCCRLSSDHSEGRAEIGADATFYVLPDDFGCTLHEPREGA